jgi:hypothetical protein
LSNPLDDKPFLKLYPASKKLYIQDSIIILFLFFLFTGALIGNVDALIIVWIALILIAAFRFGFYRYLQKWDRVEFYNYGFSVMSYDKVINDVQYTDIVRIVKKRRGLYFTSYLVYSKQNKIVASLGIGNPKKRELGGLRVIDWLNRKITPSLES